MLVAATSVVGAAGAGYALVPFVASMNPSARARAAGAPVEADISKLEPGALLRVKWRGKPVWIIKRTPEQIKELPELDSQLADPQSKRHPEEFTPPYAMNEARSIKPEVLVVVGICTHLGCAPKLHAELKPEPFDPDWKGGFFCPCHKSRFDMAGRVYDGVPAPTNLVVPPYYFIDDNHIMIGQMKGAA